MAKEDVDKSIPTSLKAGSWQKIRRKVKDYKEGFGEHDGKDLFLGKIFTNRLKINI
jgi:hypothetical protein